MALTIRLNPEAEINIEKIKKAWGINSSSKALLFAAKITANDYSNARNELHETKLQLDMLERKYQVAKNLLEEYFNTLNNLNNLIKEDK